MFWFIVFVCVCVYVCVPRAAGVEDGAYARKARTSHFGCRKTHKTPNAKIEHTTRNTKIRRANGPWRVRSLRPCPRSFFSLIPQSRASRPGTLGDQSPPLADYPERSGRPLGAQSSIFIDFLTTQIDMEKSTIFRILKNQQKLQNQSTLGFPRSVFEAKLRRTPPGAGRFK